MSSAITNPEKVIAAINDFVELVKSKDGDRPISFVDENSFLGNKKYGEGYKMSVAESAQNELNFDEWDESWINSGKILERCKRAMRAKNLVNHHEIIRVGNIIDPKHEKFNPDTEIRLIDAHSCLWVIGFKEWYKEHKW